MKTPFASKFVSTIVLGSSLCLSAVRAQAAPWLALGPYGGDARSFAADPHDPTHIYLGTATGFIYDSVDTGRTWRRLARLGKHDDLVLDHIIVDPLNSKHVLVSAWMLNRPDGGLYESNDSGLTWASPDELKGQSIRALTISPTDPHLLIAGTLKGVYRSTDSGAHWTLISPEGSTEIHEIESVAIDPNDPKKIFAGTWHLPWRTVDGGATWVNITEKDGIHDDSDIFSIIIDPHQPQTVYASACSGIYKSVNGGFRFERTRADQLGLDHMAIRTRKLMQDPTRPSVVFAGTTEGLWRTLDAGNHWMRMTANNVIVNDVYVDPASPDHVLIATDRAGVLVSTDDGVTFHDANAGFSARQVTSFANDAQHPATVYAGVVNDKDSGGVFMSLDGGVRWQQQSAGLNGRDVYSLAVTADDSVLAGTSHGIFKLNNGAWSASGNVFAKPQEAMPKVVAKPVARPGAKLALKSTVAVKTKAAGSISLDAAVYALVANGQTVYAGTSQGLYQSTLNGQQWTAVSTLQMPETRFVASEKAMVAVAGLRRLSLSVDSGKTFDTVSLPDAITQVTALSVDSTGNIWVGGREGLYYSTDYGLTWKTLRNLYVTRVTGIYFDAVGNQVLVTSEGTTLTFAAHLPDYKVTYIDTGWDLRFVRPVGTHLIGATNYDGVVVQPVMVDTAKAE